jgi:hypothetical protein
MGKEQVSRAPQGIIERKNWAVEVSAGPVPGEIDELRLL